MAKNYFQSTYKKKTKGERQKLSFERHIEEIKKENSINISFEKGDRLPDNYPVFWDYTYFADNRVITSDIQGTVSQLIQDLYVKGYNVENIYKCIHKYKEN